MRIKQLAFISAASILAASIVCGQKVQAFWGSNYSKISCKDLREEIVELTVGEDWELIKIYEPTLVSRSSTRVQCKGIGAFTTGDEIPIKFSAYKDREGDWMIEYSAL